MKPRTRQLMLLLLIALPAAPVVGYAGFSAGAADNSPAGLVRDVQEAIRMWDFSLMTNRAARLAALPKDEDATAAYHHDYWRGVALLHAVFFAREAGESHRAKRFEPELRREALAVLERASEFPDATADTHAAVVVLLGMTIKDGSWLTALRLGPGLMRHKQAAERDRANPRVAYLLGVGELRSGRSANALAAAREQLLRAVAQFEAERRQPVAGPYEARWGYDHALMFLGEVSQRQGNTEEASSWFARAYAANPHLEKSREMMQ